MELEIFQKKIPRTVTKIYDGGDRLLIATKLNNGKKGMKISVTLVMMNTFRASSLEECSVPLPIF